MAVLLSVWSANRGMKAMIVAVGVTYEELERHPFVRENLLSLGFVVGGVVFLSVAATLLARLGWSSTVDQVTVRVPASCSGWDTFTTKALASESGVNTVVSCPDPDATMVPAVKPVLLGV
jgi:uncharacterized BrkB/YihY/UPF0761 family membrane protein